MLSVILASGITLSYGLLFTVGDAIQSRYVKPDSGAKGPAVAAGDVAPALLVKCLPKLPAIAIVYPSCRECSVENPSRLRQELFKVEVIAVVPGASEAELSQYRKSGTRCTFRTADPDLAQALGIRGAPRVFRVAEDGRIDYIQPSYIPGDRLHEIVNGL